MTKGTLLRALSGNFSFSLFSLEMPQSPVPDPVWAVLRDTQWRRRPRASTARLAPLQQLAAPKALVARMRPSLHGGVA